MDKYEYWGNNYIPFSYSYDNKIVANVSVNLLDFIIEGKQHRAIQIGTVMTHPEFRHRGLSKQLMNIVLEEYKHLYDFMYLFANERVLDFYPKFGFEIVQEYQYSTNISSNLTAKNEFRKLDITNKADLQFIYTFAKERLPVSNRFATGNSKSIFMYHCLNVFSNDLYYHPAENAIVIFTKEKDEIEIFDIISKRPVNIQNLLLDLSGKGSYKITFHYTPDYEGMKFAKKQREGGGKMFVKTNGDHFFPEKVKHPMTSEA
ncbi:GNAT family N-acetyltransferase [Metabacillus sp. Hm71]|uniref:GNAT family N-acetyltransferase n=1 Tax=Metabacillus sp. Hm71 TaxID=3450743 RepID=UPI003F42A052